MRRFTVIVLAVAFLVGAMASPALAKDKDGDRADQIQKRIDRIEKRVEKLKDRFTQPITFWVNTTESIEFQPIEQIKVGDKVTDPIDLGSGCISDDLQESANWTVVTVSEATGGEEIEVTAIFTEDIKKRSVIVDVTFVEYCFSETDGQWYAKFDGMLIKQGKAKRLTRKLMRRVDRLENRLDGMEL